MLNAYLTPFPSPPFFFALFFPSLTENDELNAKVREKYLTFFKNSSGCTFSLLILISENAPIIVVGSPLGWTR